jgi:acyl transferase domain-containing protein
VTDGKEPLEISQFTKSGASPNLVFVFTGQGAQWAGMGKELMEDYDVFRDVISEMDKVLAQLPQPCLWNIKDELLKPKEMSQIYMAEFSQPLCTAVQVAIVEVLASLGIRPKAVVGHSSGEIAAAYASGAIDAKQAMKIAYYRGQVTKKQTRSGGMAAIGLGWNEVSKYLVDGVVIACENSPDSTTISGDEKELDAVLTKIKEGKPGVLTRRLPVGIAYHSRMYFWPYLGIDSNQSRRPHACGRGYLQAPY